MAIRTIATDLTLTGEKAFNDQMKAVNSNLKNLKSEMAVTASAFDSSADSTETLAKKQRILQETVDQQREKVRALTEMYAKQIETSGENSAAADKYRQQMNYATADLNKLEKQLAEVTSEQEACAQESGRLAKLWDTLKDASASAGGGLKLGAKGVAAVTSVAAAGIVALIKIEEETAEFRENQAKLNAAFDATGHSVGTAQTAYTELFKVLGDSDTATESAQLLAQLASSEQDVANWSTIAAGVVGTFGDALPINSLIEATNETAKVGQVTGALADALNWVGLSEDEFNAKLSACSSEQERNQLITAALTDAYGAASDAYREHNAEIIAANEAQAELDATLSKLGGAVSSVKGKLVAEFLPSIAEVVSAFVDFVNGVDGAEEALQAAVQNMVDNLADRLPEFLDFGVELITALASGIIQNLPYLIGQLPGIVLSILEGFGDLGDGLVDVGEQMLEGLWQGIQNAAGWLWDNVTGLVGGIKDIFTGANGFDIHSPSKWSRNVFENVMLGGVSGLDTGAPKLRRAFTDVVEQIKTDADDLNVNTRFDISANPPGSWSSATSPVSQNSGAVVHLTVNSTRLTQAEIDYLIMRVNQELGRTG